MSPLTSPTSTEYVQTTYAYDANGNLVSEARQDQIRGYAWDGENRMVSVALSEDRTETYAYDALNRRVRKGEDSLHVWSGNTMVYGTSPDLEHSIIHVFLGGMLVADVGRSKGSGDEVSPAATQPVFYIHSDALGSVVAITNANGNKVEGYSYEPFGATKTPEGKTTHQFVGAYGVVFDSSTSLHYMVNRYYAGVHGIFIGPDPIGHNSKFGKSAIATVDGNTYIYSRNNPAILIDPLGLYACCSQSGVSGNITIGIGAELGWSSFICKEECGGNYKITTGSYLFVCLCGGAMASIGVDLGPIECCGSSIEELVGEGATFGFITGAAGYVGGTYYFCDFGKGELGGAVGFGKGLAICGCKIMHSWFNTQ